MKTQNETPIARMDVTSLYKKLLYEHEVLWARYEIRDHHLKKVGERIYDDIGQVLSLVRIQLCRPGHAGGASESGELVGSAIRGLRDMHRSFYPEKELREKGLLETFGHELELSGLNAGGNPIAVQGNPHDLPTGTQLIVFRMLQEIVSLTAPAGENGVAVAVVYDEHSVRFSIRYNGTLPQWQQPAKADAGETGRLNLTERAALIGGDLIAESSTAGLITITLIVPFETSAHES